MSPLEQAGTVQEAWQHFCNIVGGALPSTCDATGAADAHDGADDEGGDGTFL
jgi:hypothetical protein